MAVFSTLGPGGSDYFEFPSGMQEKCDTMVMSSDYLILDALPEKIWLPVDGKRTWY